MGEKCSQLSLRKYCQPDSKSKNKRSDRDRHHSSIHDLYGLSWRTTQLFAILFCFFNHSPTSPYPSRHAISAIVSLFVSPESYYALSCSYFQLCEHKRTLHRYVNKTSTIRCRCTCFRCSIEFFLCDPCKSFALKKLCDSLLREGRRV